jgi:hypothetical protein
MVSLRQLILEEPIAHTAKYSPSNRPDWKNIPIPSWVCQELYRYNDKAGRILSPHVIEYVEQFKPKESVVLYRGLGFGIAEAVSILNKLKIKDPVVGLIGRYKTGKFQSWTRNKDIAEYFAGKYWVSGRDPNSLGIVLKAIISPEQIAVPFGTLPKSVKNQCMRLEQDEFILQPGIYEVEIVKMLGKWPSKMEQSLDISKIFKRIGAELAQQFNGALTKNWEKSPGFGIDLIKFERDHDRGKWSPSVQIFYRNDNRITIEANPGRDARDIPEKELKFKTLEQASQYINSEKFKQDVALMIEKVIKVQKRIISRED